MMLDRTRTAPLALAAVLTAAAWDAGCAARGGANAGDVTGRGDASAAASVMPIASVRAGATGSAVTVEGHVTVAPGTFASATGERGFAIQDESGGIYVSVKRATALPLGARVRVRGALEVVNGQRQLGSVRALDELDGASAIAPIPVGTGAVDERVGGKLVRIAGRVTKPVVDDLPHGYKVFVDDTTGEIQVFVHIVSGAPIVDISSLHPGDEVEVIGLAGRYEATHEIMPRVGADLTKTQRAAR